MRKNSLHFGTVVLLSMFVFLGLLHAPSMALAMEQTSMEEAHTEPCASPCEDAGPCVDHCLTRLTSQVIPAAMVLPVFWKADTRIAESHTHGHRRRQRQIRPWRDTGQRHFSTQRRE